VRDALLALMVAKVDLNAVVIVLLGGGFLTGLAALMKFKPEKDAIVVSAAQGAVVVQTSVIDALQEELDRARREKAEVHTELESCRKHNHDLRIEIETIRQRLGNA
jgi:hypothetical protein